MPTAFPAPDKVAAFFDMDGTLVQSHIVHYYCYLRLRGRSAPGRALWYACFAPRALCYLIVDKISRSRFNRLFYRNYCGMDSTRAHADARELFDEFIRPRLFAGARAAVRRHRECGHHTVLVTGSLDFIVRPLQEYLGIDLRLSVSLREERGRFTGELAVPPLGGEEKARAVRAHARKHRLDLGSSYAYGNDAADIPMLRSVGHPVAVNPRGTLAALAARQSWEVRRWSLSSPFQ